MSVSRWLGRAWRPVVLVAALAAMLPREARAQSDTVLARLDAATRVAVSRIIDSTRAAGLPTTPLEWKVAEGLTKGADGARIVAAVQRSADGLRRAREALGQGAGTPELIAGASALQVGATPAMLRALQSAQPGQPVTLRLVVLSDLVSRGVPLDDASGALLRLARSGASDAELSELRRSILRDVQAGVPPARALSARARELSGPRPRSAMADSLHTPPE